MQIGDLRQAQPAQTVCRHQGRIGDNRPPHPPVLACIRRDALRFRRAQAPASGSALSGSAVLIAARTQATNVPPKKPENCASTMNTIT